MGAVLPEPYLILQESWHLPEPCTYTYASCLVLQAGRPTDAVHAYYEAMCKASSQPCPLRMYLRMAQSYIQLRHADYALDVYVQVRVRC